MADREIRVRLMAEIQNYQQGLKTAAGATSEFGREITGLQKSAGVNLEKVGRGALIMSGMMAAGLGLSLKAAVDWESAWAGVTKTVNGTESQMANLEAGLRNLAGELPATHAEIAGVAEAAGQLGISVGGIETFTETMINLGETTNLTADQAATALARISNIMGTSERDIERMGSTIVELGNNSATTEAEIVELATRLAAAGKIAGLSEADVFAFASTLTSVGVEAEAGGSALSKVFTSIRDAVIDGGDNLETFADVAGVTVGEFSSMFRDDASGAIALFVEGLGRLNDSGASTTAVFEDLELTDRRLMTALLSTASAGDLLTEQLDMASRAWEENTALQTEAEQRYKTTAAQMEILRNKVTDLGIDAGSVLLPALNGLVDVLGNFADGLAALPGPMKTALVGLTGITTAGVGAVGVMATLAPKIAAMKTALSGMGTGAQFLGRNLGKIAGGAAAVGAAIGAGVLIYEAATRSSREYDAGVKELTGRLLAAADAQSSLNDEIDNWAAEEFEGLSESARQAFLDLGITMDDVLASIRSGGDALGPLREKLDELGITAELAGGRLMDVGKWDDSNAHQVVAALNELESATGASADGVKGLIEASEDWDNTAQDSAQAAIEIMLGLNELTQAEVDAAAAALGLADASENWQAVLAHLRPATAATTTETEGFTSAIEAEEAAVASVEDAISNMMEAFDALIGVHISANEAVLDTTEGFLELTETLKENGATLEANTQEGRDNQRQINSTVDDIFKEIEARRNEGESIDEVTRSALGHVEALKDTMRQAGFSEAAIAEYTRELGLTPDNVVTIVKTSGIPEAEAQFNNLARNRTMTVSAIAKLSGDPRAQAILRGNFAQGGEVPNYLAAGGPPTSYGPRGSDTIPAFLTPGEFVMRKSAVDDLGVQFLSQLNRRGSDALSTRHMASGGSTSSTPSSVDLNISIDSGDGIIRYERKRIKVEAGGSAEVFFRS